MKTRSFQRSILTITVAISAAISLLAGNVMAQDSSTTTAAPSTAQPAAAGETAPQLSYGVTQIMDLSHAKVADSTIIAYIRNSGNNYGLDAAQIIYLKQQGVSTDVINVMLNQRTQATQNTAQTATSQPASSPDTYNAQTSTVATQPTVTYVEPAPSSTVYVVPDTQTYRYDDWYYYQQPYAYYPYGYYPYGGYYGWPYPAVSLSFGWGGYWGGGHGGGWHGGGGGGGHHH